VDVDDTLIHKCCINFVLIFDGVFQEVEISLFLIKHALQYKYVLKRKSGPTQVAADLVAPYESLTRWAANTK